MPVARELFAQWQRARGQREDAARRPFARDWETLLEDAHLLSATERREAEQDARALAADGWVELKTVRYRPHLLSGVIVPLAAEERWCQAFGFVAPPPDEARQILEFAWVPEMAFVREARLHLSFTELRQLHDFLARGGAGRPIVPVKERSLEIFGDEKRLDTLLATALFRAPDRLDLQKHLRCETVGVPLAWQRGPAAAAQRPLIVLENAATWHSYVRWNTQHALFSGVIYGDGNRFIDAIRYLPNIFAELGGLRPLCYFGDLDPPGLFIPQEASARALAAGGSPVLPHLWSYRQLLVIGEDRAQPWNGEPASHTLCDWLGELGDPVRSLFARGQRLAQEYVGWEFLRDQAGLQTNPSS